MVVGLVNLGGAAPSLERVMVSLPLLSCTVSSSLHPPECKGNTSGGRSSCFTSEAVSALLIFNGHMMMMMMMMMMITTQRRCFDCTVHVMQRMCVCTNSWTASTMCCI